MKSILAVVGGLLAWGVCAHAGDGCPPPSVHPASVCQPVAAHVVHCHTTSCCVPCNRVCVSPCGKSSSRTCASSCARACGIPCGHVHGINGAYSKPAVRVVVRRNCLPRTVTYRSCYSACCW